MDPTEKVILHNNNEDEVAYARYDKYRGLHLAPPEKSKRKPQDDDWTEHQCQQIFGPPTWRERWAWLRDDLRNDVQNPEAWIGCACAIAVVVVVTWAR